jgi:cell division septation protein DedD
VLSDDITVQVSSVTHEKKTIFRVRVGPVESSEKLNELQELLIKNGLSEGQRLP